MGSADVSVIVPVYNEICYLKECVNSIRNQSISSIEIILIDDGSTNGAQDICDEFARLDSRVIVKHKQNEGLSSARLDGFLMASGEWIMFVDDDDVIAPVILEKLIKYGKSDHDLEIVTAQFTEDLNCVDTENEYLDDRSSIVEGKEFCNHLADHLYSGFAYPLWGKIYKKSFLDKINLEKYKRVCPTIFLEDVLMTPILLCEARKICIVECVYYFHRKVETSLSTARKLGPFYYEQIKSGDLLLKYLKKKGLYLQWDYELKKYMRTILRLWCLSIYDKKEIRLAHEKDILKMYYRYRKRYLSSSDKWYMKILIMLFGITRHIWRVMANHVYFKKNNKELMKSKNI